MKGLSTQMETRKATAIAHPNIAFIKYWGNHDARLRMPLNDSVSMNLEAMTTETTVEFDDAMNDDEITLLAGELDEKARARVFEQLSRIRALAKITAKARVSTRNNFPSAVGLASSASAYAALTVAASQAAGLDLNERALSILARQGSGSAARSIPAGFVEMIAATSTTATSDQSFARSIMTPDAWELRDVVVIVSRDAKSVGSSQGHASAHTSPFMGERLSRLPTRYHRVRRELLAKNLRGMGPEIEAEAVELHAIAMTSRPPIFYWAPGTVRVMDAVRRWRNDGLEAYFTLDAGPNVHVICEAKNADAIAANARELRDVQEVIVSASGGGTRLINDHLF